MTIVDNCRIINLAQHHSDRQGVLSVVDSCRDIPFATKRIYYLYDVPGGAERGGHAHKALQQLIVAASGSFTVLLDDGKNKQSVSLNRPYQGLSIVPGIWRELVDFSSGAICLVLASEKYDEDDYIREYDDFLKFKNQ